MYTCGIYTYTYVHMVYINFERLSVKPCLSVSQSLRDITDHVKVK